MLRRYRLLAPDTGGNPTGGEPQAGDPTNAPQPQAGTTTSTEPQAGDSPIETISLEEAKKLRSESQNLRKREKELAAKLAAYEEAEQKAKDAGKSEAELTKQQMDKLQKQLADMQAAREADVERLIAAEIRTQAAEMGIQSQYLKRVATMLDWEELDIDESTGMPTNIDKVLAALIKEMPFLAKAQQTPTSGGATNPSRSQTQNGEITNDFVRDVLAGKVDWKTLSNEQRTAVLNFQAKNPYGWGH